MLTFEVKDMTCGHCVATITKAVKAADRDATVDIDLGQQRVRIEPGSADAQTLTDAISEAGYTPVPLAMSGASPAAEPSKAGGGCCGC